MRNPNFEACESQMCRSACHLYSPISTRVIRSLENITPKVISKATVGLFSWAGWFEPLLVVSQMTEPGRYFSHQQFNCCCFCQRGIVYVHTDPIHLIKIVFLFKFVHGINNYFIHNHPAPLCVTCACADCDHINPALNSNNWILRMTVSMVRNETKVQSFGMAEK